MIHTIAAVENICTTVKSLEMAMNCIIGNDAEAEKNREGIRVARGYILSAANVDKKFGTMCKLFTEALNRDLTYIDISDMDLYVRSDEVISLFKEFGVGKFTMSMSNTATMTYASDFCDSGYHVTGMCKLNDGKPTITFMMN